MTNLTKVLLTMLFVSSLGLAVVAGKNISDRNSNESVPATDTLPVEEPDYVDDEPKGNIFI